jgi:hypothetical protein
MKFEHAITVRSQAGKNADYGRALERVAFFPGVTEANLVGEDAGSVTIGYNGQQSDKTSRDFCSDLEADGLVADGHLWDARRLFGGRDASNAIALFCRQTWRGHFQATAIARHGPRTALSATHSEWPVLVGHSGCVPSIGTNAGSFASGLLCSVGNLVR